MKFSVLLTFILFNISAPAQVQRKDYPSNKLRCQFFELEALTGKDSLPLPFFQIRFMDVRTDTSKYGFFRPPGIVEQFKYCFKDGAGAQITRFANAYLVNNLDSSKTDHVLMCLRKLWIMRDDTTIIKQGLTKNRAKTLFKADFYLYSNNAFHPLFRFDTTITRESLKRVYALGMVEEVLAAALERLKNTDYVRASARSITEEEISEYYGRMYNIPALTTNRPAKGVYRTFQEFKQNQPSDTAFEIKFEALADHLYLKDKSGNQYLERNVWGISDGDNVFIRVNDNFYQLFRHQNTWELYAINRLERYKPIMPNPMVQSAMPQTALLTLGVLEMISMANFNAKKISAYQLDLETGKIF